MKANVFKLIIVSILVATLTACGFNISPNMLGSITRVTGSGTVATESRNVSGFTGVVLNGAGQVSIDRTGTESVSVTTDDNLLSYIVTEVRGGKLVIEFKPNVVTDKLTALTFKITVKDLNTLESNGAVSIDAKNIEADRLSVNVNGAGTIKVQGKIAQQEVTLSGASAYNAENVEGKRATIKNDGAGVAIVRVSDTLNATINGLGYIDYIGSPQVTKSVSGLGAVRQR